MAAIEEEITLETRGRVAVIILNRPKKLNALGQAHYVRLAALMRDVAARDEVHITVLAGKGRFFSAGADVAVRSDEGAERTASATRWHYLQRFAAQNLELTHAFSTHPKILVAALNGPAVGLSAALVAHADFVYAAPHMYLLTPFSALGLVAEGGASRAFVQRLGIAKANEALLMSRRLTCAELLAVGFVNKVFEGIAEDGREDARFLELVLREVDERLGTHLNTESLLGIKALIRQPERDALGSALVDELMGGVHRLEAGIPQAEFAKLASGKKRHKL